jgi:glycosyltransferase involved in cell wall biosynthesis
MRIGLIIYGSLETVSGGYLYDRKLVEYLRSRGDHVTVISLPYRNYADHLLDNFSGSLAQRLRKARFDFLLEDEMNHPSLFWLNRALRPQAHYPIIPIIHHLRSSERRPAWQNLFYRWVEWLFLTSASGYVFNSQTTKGVVEGLVRGKRPSVVAPPGGDQPAQPFPADRVTARAHREGPLKVLFVGNLIPRKGLHILLDALSRLDPARWRLTVAGSPEADPAYAARIRAQIVRANLGSNVNLVGLLTGSALLDQYANHQLLAVPSSYEGYGIVYVEGMGFGLPAIGTSGGAAGEIITNDIDGFLIRPGDTQGLAGCIQSLITDRELLAHMSLAARARYDRHPTWEQSAQAIRSFIQRFPIPMPVTRPLRSGPA